MKILEIGGELKISPGSTASALKMTVDSVGKLIVVKQPSSLRVARRPRQSGFQNSRHNLSAAETSLVRRSAERQASLPVKHCENCRLEFAGKGPLCPACASQKSEDDPTADAIDDENEPACSDDIYDLLFAIRTVNEWLEGPQAGSAEISEELARLRELLRLAKSPSAR